MEEFLNEDTLLLICNLLPTYAKLSLKNVSKFTHKIVKIKRISSNVLTDEVTKDGHLSMLKWLKEKGQGLNSKTCAIAAEYDHLDLLKWTREIRGPWDASTCSGAALN